MPSILVLTMMLYTPYYSSHHSRSTTLETLSTVSEELIVTVYTDRMEGVPVGNVKLAVDGVGHLKY